MAEQSLEDFASSLGPAEPTVPKEQSAEDFANGLSSKPVTGITELHGQLVDKNKSPATLGEMSKLVGTPLGDVAAGIPEFAIKGMYNLWGVAAGATKAATLKALDEVQGKSTVDFYKTFEEFVSQHSAEMKTETAKFGEKIISTGMGWWTENVTKPQVEKYINKGFGWMADPKAYEMVSAGSEALRLRIDGQPPRTPEEEATQKKLLDEPLSNKDVTFNPFIATAIHTVYDAIPQFALMLVGKRAAGNKGTADAAAGDRAAGEPPRNPPIEGESVRIDPNAPQLPAPTKPRVGPDLRPYEEASKDWFKQDKIVNTDTGKFQDKLAPTLNDWKVKDTKVDKFSFLNPEDAPISDRISIAKQFKEWTAPGKFIGMENPVIKWGVDRIDHISTIADNHVERILFAPEITTGAGKPKSPPTEKGTLFAWKQLNTDAERMKVIETYYKYDDPRYAEVIPFKHLQDIDGLSPTQIKAYYGLKAGPQQVVTVRNFFGEKYKGEGEYEKIQSNPNYGHRVWEGDYRIHVRSKLTGAGGAPLITRSANSFREANKLIATLKEHLGKDADVYDFGVETKRFDSAAHRALSGFAEAMVYAERKGMSGEAAAMEKMMDEISLSRGFGVHAKERQGTRGFKGDPDMVRRGLEDVPTTIKDFETSYISYITQGVKAAYSWRTDYELGQVLNDKNVVKHYPNARKYLDGYYRQYMGESSWLDRKIEDFSITLGQGQTGLFRKQQALNTIVLYNKLFFHRLAYPDANILQPLEAIPAYLYKLQGMGYKGDIAGSVAASYKSIAFPTSADSMAMRIGMMERVYAPKFIEQFYSSEYWSQSKDMINATLFSKEWFKSVGVDWALGKKLPSIVEEYSRLQAHMMLFNYLKSAGVPIEKAARDSAYLAKILMVEYTRAEKASVLAGPTMSAAGQFKSYGLNYVYQGIDHYNTAKATGDVKPMATFMGTKLLTAGVTGLVAWKAIDAALEAMGQQTATDYALQHFPDSVVYGAKASATGAYNPSASAPQNMGEFISLPVSWQWAGKVSKYSATLASKAATGMATQYDVQNLLSELLPLSMTGSLERAMNAGDLVPLPSDDPYLVRDSKYRMQGMLKRTFSDDMVRILGYRSLDEQRTLEAVRQLTRFDKNKEKTLQDLADYAAATITLNLNNNFNVPIDFIVRQAAEEYGEPPKTFAERIRSSYSRQNLDILERLGTSKGNKPKQMYLDLLDRVPSLRDEDSVSAEDMAKELK